MGIVTPENISAHVPLEVPKTAGLCIFMIQSMVPTFAKLHGILRQLGGNRLGTTDENSC